MDVSELRKKSTVELNDEMQSLLREQFSLRMQKGAGQVNNPARFKSVRRDIARVKTILNELGNNA